MNIKMEYQNGYYVQLSSPRWTGQIISDSDGARTPAFIVRFDLDKYGNRFRKPIFKRVSFVFLDIINYANPYEKPAIYRGSDEYYFKPSSIARAEKFCIVEQWPLSLRPIHLFKKR